MDSRGGGCARAAAVWLGVGVALGGAVVVEALVLGEWLVPAAAVTAVVALTGGIVATRKLRARTRQTLITVKDLRRR